MKLLKLLSVGVCTFMSCQGGFETRDEITLNKNGDTVEVIKRYPSKKIREIVTYRNNMPVDNIGFYETGDTITEPEVIFTAADSMLFAFLPLREINSANIYLGMDSLKYEQTYYLRIHDSICTRLSGLKRSTGFRLRQELLVDQELAGVFECKMKSNEGEPRYFPFRTKIKSGEQGPDTLRRKKSREANSGVSIKLE